LSRSPSKSNEQPLAGPRESGQLMLKLLLEAGFASASELLTSHDCLNQSFFFSSSTKSIGRLATPIPAASNAAIFSAAVPAEPDMIAPA
jgi:hypothetical protein